MSVTATNEREFAYVIVDLREMLARNPWSARIPRVLTEVSANTVNVRVFLDMEVRIVRTRWKSRMTMMATARRRERLDA